MKKKKYENPEMEVVDFEGVMVITEVSVGNIGGGVDNGESDPFDM